jgi:hypothetical protein
MIAHISTWTPHEQSAQIISLDFAVLEKGALIDTSKDQVQLQTLAIIGFIAIVHSNETGH